MDCSMPGLPVCHKLPLLAQTHVHWAGDAIQPSHPLPSPSPPTLNLSQHQGHFKWVSSSHQVAKALEFQLQYQSFQWIFRTDLLAFQGTLKSILQHHSSKASILWHSAFFIVQLSHPYMTTGKTIALVRWTFVGKVMSLLFNMLSRLLMAFLPRSKRLFTSWLQSSSSVILEPPSPQKNKVGLKLNIQKLSDVCVADIFFYPVVYPHFPLCALKETQHNFLNLKWLYLSLFLIAVITHCVFKINNFFSWDYKENLLFVCLFSNFWPRVIPCWLLVPWPGIEPVPSALEVQSHNHWPPGNSQDNFITFEIIVFDWHEIMLISYFT